MIGYRLHFLDADGTVIRREYCQLADDAAARARACELDHAYAIEICQGERLVGWVYPDSAFGRGGGAVTTAAPRSG